jgi:SPX domain protein involved in polyphosphate accumulation
MVQFGKKFSSDIIDEWKGIFYMNIDQYFDYDKLKKLIEKLHKKKKKKENIDDICKDFEEQIQLEIKKVNQFYCDRERLICVRQGKLVQQLKLYVIIF